MQHPIEQLPGEEFRGVIEKFWLFPRTGGDGRWLLDAPPDGNFNLVFALSGSGCRAVFVGPFTERRNVPMFERCDYFCVLFRPGIMPRLADVAAGDLVDTWTEVTKVLGANPDELGEGLTRAGDPGAMRTVAEDFFRRAGLASALPNETYRRAAGAVTNARGRIRVDGLAERLGVTARTLERMFREHAGLSPKKFIRLVRFQDVLSRLRTGNSFRTLADLACECEYADQSHLIRDFRSLMRLSPGEL